MPADWFVDALTHVELQAATHASGDRTVSCTIIIMGNFVGLECYSRKAKQVQSSANIVSKTDISQS